VITFGLSLPQFNQNPTTTLVIVAFEHFASTTIAIRPDHYLKRKNGRKIAD
jgi:hypothetical protein